MWSFDGGQFGQWSGGWKVLWNNHRMFRSRGWTGFQTFVSNGKFQVIDKNSGKFPHFSMKIKLFILFLLQGYCSKRHKYCWDMWGSKEHCCLCCRILWWTQDGRQYQGIIFFLKKAFSFVQIMRSVTTILFDTQWLCMH